MSRKQLIFGIASIVLSIPFYYIVRLIHTTDRLDKFYQQNFIFAVTAIFLVLPALIIGFAIAALKQKDHNKYLAYLSAIISVPVFLYSLWRLVITTAYIMIGLSSR
jgi:hypothetical protein